MRKVLGSRTLSRWFFKWLALFCYILEVGGGRGLEEYWVSQSCPQPQPQETLSSVAFLKPDLWNIHATLSVPGIEYVCICVCICTCVYEYMCMYVCVCGGQRSTSLISLSSGTIYLISLRQALSLAWNSHVGWAGWASEPHRASCVCFSGAGIIGVHRHVSFDAWVLGVKLRSSCLPGKNLTPLMTKPSLLTLHNLPKSSATTSSFSYTKHSCIIIACIWEREGRQSGPFTHAI